MNNTHLDSNSDTNNNNVCSDHVSSQKDVAKDLVINLPGNVDLEMVYCPKGTFMMGSCDSELGRENNEDYHQVTLTKDFYIGRYPVTQAQYQLVMGNNPSKFQDNNNPVDGVTLDDAVIFCKRMNEKFTSMLPKGYEVLLPTEAQWEYACRGGTTTALNSGCNLTSEKDVCENLSQVAWYNKNSEGKTHPVGQKKANRWGLHDMHGNVHEWCSDKWVYSLGTDPVTDPKGGDTFGDYVVRGGCWREEASSCRSARRCHFFPEVGSVIHGFRIALQVKPKTKRVLSCFEKLLLGFFAILLVYYLLKSSYSLFLFFLT